MLQHPEIWLTGLVSLAAEVVRMGVRDLFTSWPGEGRGDCYWAGRGAVWGVGSVKISDIVLIRLEVH